MLRNIFFCTDAGVGRRFMKIVFLLVFLSCCLIAAGEEKEILLKTADLEDIIAIRSFLMNEKGEMFLFSSKLAQIFKFKPDGVFEKSFCRRGEGPGEISRVFEMYFNPLNDFLYLPEYYSMKKGRITIYDSSGSYKGLLKPEIPLRHLDRVSDILFFKDGTYVLVTRERVDWKKHGKFFLTQDEVLVRSFKADSKLISRVFRTHLNDELSNAVRYGGPPILFAPTVRIAAAPDGNIAIAKTDENTVSVYNKQGEKIKTITLEISKEKLPVELFKKEKEILIEDMKRYDSRMVMLAKNMIQLEYKPIFDRLFFPPGYIVLSTIIEKDESGYARENELLFFSLDGKKKGEKVIKGRVKSWKKDKALIILYDDEGNETYKVKPGVFTLSPS